MSAYHLEEITVPFNAITGISPHNPRRNRDEADIARTEASLVAKGLLDKLVLHCDPARPQNYLVLKGGTRWLALQRALKAGTMRLEDGHLGALLARGADETELRDIALTLDIIRSALHPVEEFEAFARIEALGPEKIAAAYGLTVRQVKQRLALGKLSPAVREAWRAGRIDGDQAKAFTAAGGDEAQARLLEELAAPGRPVTRTAAEIRRLATEGAMPATAPEALYVGAEEYLAAGGRIDEDLFGDGAYYRDGALLRGLAAAKLERHGHLVADAEGWGLVLKPGTPCRPAQVQVRPSADDSKRLEKLDLEINATEDRAKLVALIGEEDEIHGKMYRRSISVAQRRKLGICVTLDSEGFASTERALEPVVEKLAAPKTEEKPEPAKKGKKAKAEPPAPVNRAPDEGDAFEDDAAEPLHTVLRCALNTALTSCVKSRPDLAMIVTGAVLSDVMNTEHVQDGLLSGMAYVISAKCGNALPRLALMPYADLQTAFAQIVADMIDVHRVDTATIEALVRAVASRGADLADAAIEALDYDAYFKAATKEACVQAIGACEGIEALVEANKLTKKKAQPRAAESAKANRWLPHPLRDWLLEPVTFTADEAMCLSKPAAKQSEAA